jgi:TIR domain
MGRISHHTAANMTERWDVFICHASEDKEAFVRPLAEGLRRLGVAVWYDEFSLDVGDSLSQAIDRGIAGSRFGIIVISKAFIVKPWANHELRGLVNRDIEEDFKILPIWHGVRKDEVRAFSPSLSDKLAIDTRKDDAQDATIKLLRIIRRDLYDAHPHAELEKLASGEAMRELQEVVDELRAQLSQYQCPSCGAAIVGQEYIEFDERSSGVVETFECGYSRGGWEERPCPFDPKFPKLEEYDLEVSSESEGAQTFMCYAKPRTEMARKVHLPVGIGRTESEARDYVAEHYLYLITPPRQEFRGKWIQRSGYKKPDDAS